MATVFNVDLDMDLTRNVFSDDISVKLNKQAIRQSVINLAMTRPGERPFSLDSLGGGLEDVIFENDTRSLEYIALEKRIKRSINRYEPRVRFDSMSIEKNGTTATLTIIYTYNTPSLPNNTSDGVILTVEGQ
jgi:phage baseplate assembly protein W